MTFASQLIKASVLITDDDPRQRHDLCEMIESQGMSVVPAESGEEALDILARESVDLLICDMYMPRMTGLETLTLARQLAYPVPFILVSAEVDQRLMRRALEARAYAVISKPIGKQVLLYTMNRALSRFHGLDVVSE
jgi:CheY-like chemotaxis protein